MGKNEAVMTVGEWMTRRPFTVDADSTLAEAWRLMRGKRIRHLPVREKTKLVGIVSDRDIRLAFPPPLEEDREVWDRRGLMERTRVWQIMTRVVMVVPPEAPLERAAQILLRNRVGSLPVMADARLVGIITETDVLRAFVALCTAGRLPGSRAPRR